MVFVKYITVIKERPCSFWKAPFEKVRLDAYVAVKPKKLNQKMAYLS